MPLNNSGQPRYHLRRIGLSTTLPDHVKDVMELKARTTVFGRNKNQANYYISSLVQENRRYISRAHSRVIYSLSNEHKLVDSSMNGMFVNDVKIAGQVILEEGDTVTFGHPNGVNLPVGTRVRQPESEYHFVFELCDCDDGGNQRARNTPQQIISVSPLKKSDCDDDGQEFKAPAVIPVIMITTATSPAKARSNLVSAAPQNIRPEPCAILTCDRNSTAVEPDTTQSREGNMQPVESGNSVAVLSVQQTVSKETDDYCPGCRKSGDQAVWPLHGKNDPSEKSMENLAKPKEAMIHSTARPDKDTQIAEFKDGDGSVSSRGSKEISCQAQNARSETNDSLRPGPCSAEKQLQVSKATSQVKGDIETTQNTPAKRKTTHSMHAKNVHSLPEVRATDNPKETALIAPDLVTGMTAGEIMCSSPKPSGDSSDLMPNAGDKDYESDKENGCTVRDRDSHAIGEELSIAKKSDCAMDDVDSVVHHDIVEEIPVMEKEGIGECADRKSVTECQLDAPKACSKDEGNSTESVDANSQGGDSSPGELFKDCAGDDGVSDDHNSSVSLEVPPQKYKHTERTESDPIDDSGDDSYVTSSSVDKSEEQREGNGERMEVDQEVESDAESFVTSSSFNDEKEPRWMASDSLEFGVADGEDRGKDYSNDLDVISEGEEGGDCSTDSEGQVAPSDGSDEEEDAKIGMEKDGCLKQLSVKDEMVGIGRREEDAMESVPQSDAGSHAGKLAKDDERCSLQSTAEAEAGEDSSVDRRKVDTKPMREGENNPNRACFKVIEAENLGRIPEVAAKQGVCMKSDDKEGSKQSSRSSTPLLDMPASQDSINHHEVSSIASEQDLMSEEDLALKIETQSDHEESPAGEGRRHPLEVTAADCGSSSKAILLFGSSSVSGESGDTSDDEFLKDYLATELSAKVHTAETKVCKTESMNPEKVDGDAAFGRKDEIKLEESEQPKTEASCSGTSLLEVHGTAKVSPLTQLPDLKMEEADLSEIEEVDVESIPPEKFLMTEEGKEFRGGVDGPTSDEMLKGNMGDLKEEDDRPETVEETKETIFTQGDGDDATRDDNNQTGCLPQNENDQVMDNDDGAKLEDGDGREEKQNLAEPEETSRSVSMETGPSQVNVAEKTCVTLRTEESVGGASVTHDDVEMNEAEEPHSMDCESTPAPVGLSEASKETETENVKTMQVPVGQSDDDRSDYYKYNLQKLNRHMLGYLGKEFFRRMTFDPEGLSDFVLRHREEGFRTSLRQFFEEYKSKDPRSADCWQKEVSGIKLRLVPDDAVDSGKNMCWMDTARDVGGADESGAKIQGLGSPDSFATCEIANEKAEQESDEENFHDCLEDVRDVDMAGGTGDGAESKTDLTVSTDVKSPEMVGTVIDGDGRCVSLKEAVRSDIPQTGTGNASQKEDASCGLVADTKAICDNMSAADADSDKSENNDNATKVNPEIGTVSCHVNLASLSPHKAAIQVTRPVVEKSPVENCSLQDGDGETSGMCSRKEVDAVTGEAATLPYRATGEKSVCEKDEAKTAVTISKNHQIGECSSSVQGCPDNQPVGEASNKRPLSDVDGSDDEPCTGQSPVLKKSKVDFDAHRGKDPLQKPRPSVSRLLEVTCSFDDDSDSNFTPPLVDFANLETDEEYSDSNFTPLVVDFPNPEPDEEEKSKDGEESIVASPEPSCKKERVSQDDQNQKLITDVDVAGKKDGAAICNAGIQMLTGLANSGSVAVGSEEEKRAMSNHTSTPGKTAKGSTGIKDQAGFGHLNNEDDDFFRPVEFAEIQPDQGDKSPLPKSVGAGRDYDSDCSSADLPDMDINSEDESIGESRDTSGKASVLGVGAKRKSESPLPGESKKICVKEEPGSGDPWVDMEAGPSGLCVDKEPGPSGAETKKEKPSPSKMATLAGKVAAALGKAKDSSLAKKLREISGTKQQESEKDTPGALPSSSRAKRKLLPSARNVTVENIARHHDNCSSVLRMLKETLDSCGHLNSLTTINKWKDELKELQEKKTLAKTVIAVVGDTGAGKSSLMNALLDEEAVLPTSGMRACTAVVVEIVNNESSSRYEAEIDFLSVKEWDDELKLLLTELIDANGKVKSRPDPRSDIGIAYSKVRDVYGKIAPYDELKRMRNVTKKLGTTQKLFCQRPRDFRRQIDRYIDSNSNDAKGCRNGGQFWPIVKQVKVKIPNCGVCSSGAVLVDLPGVRDSNAARDNIAKQYLKTCTAVWVVADITRAVDNKTAKELLGESFRRQLLMDGQYGSVAFICTKNDLINPSEIIRALNLGEQCESIESKIDVIKVNMQSLQEEKDELDDRKEDIEAELESAQDDINDLKKEIHDLEMSVEVVNPDLEEDDEDSDDCSEERQQLEELRQELKEKKEYRKEKRGQLDKVEKLCADKVKEILPYEKAIESRQMELRELCAKARNDFAKTQIKRDFKAGLKEMKKKSGMLPEDADIEDDEDEDDTTFDSDDGDVDDELISTAENLKVFTVSSTEYLKLRGKLTRDGPPQVFSNIADTQIPAIRDFVHEITNTRRLQGTEKLIRSIGRYVEDLYSYLADEGTESQRARRCAKSTFDNHLRLLQENLHPILENLATEIGESFNGCILPKLKDGVGAAKELSIVTQMKWGSKVNRDDRKLGGLPWATYKAVVKRSGAYNSPTAGALDFNQDLSEPIYASIMIQWDKVFSGALARTLDSCAQTMLKTLKKFFLDLTKELETLGMALDRVMRVSQQQMDSAANKLNTAIAELKVFIQDRQRDINRIITPSIQDFMEPVYNTCTNESGPGSFNWMKGHMETHVVMSREVMFDCASEKMLEEFMMLQQEIVGYVGTIFKAICDNLAIQYQPFWDSPINTKSLRENLLTGVLQCREKVKAIYTDAKIVVEKSNLLENKTWGPASRAAEPTKAAGVKSNQEASSSNASGSNDCGSSMAISLGTARPSGIERTAPPSLCRPNSQPANGGQQFIPVRPGVENRHVRGGSVLKTVDTRPANHPTTAGAAAKPGTSRLVQHISLSKSTCTPTPSGTQATGVRATTGTQQMYRNFSILNNTATQPSGQQPTHASSSSAAAANKPLGYAANITQYPIPGQPGMRVLKLQGKQTVATVLQQLISRGYKVQSQSQVAAGTVSGVDAIPGQTSTQATSAKTTASKPSILIPPLHQGPSGAKQRGGVAHSVASYRRVSSSVPSASSFAGVPSCRPGTGYSSLLRSIDASSPVKKTAHPAPKPGTRPVQHSSLPKTTCTPTKPTATQARGVPAKAGTQHAQMYRNVPVPKCTVAPQPSRQQPTAASSSAAAAANKPLGYAASITQPPIPRHPGTRVVKLQGKQTAATVLQQLISLGYKVQSQSQVAAGTESKVAIPSQTSTSGKAAVRNPSVPPRAMQHRPVVDVKQTAGVAQYSGASKRVATSTSPSVGGFAGVGVKQESGCPSTTPRGHKRKPIALSGVIDLTQDTSDDEDKGKHGSAYQPPKKKKNRKRKKGRNWHKKNH